MGCVWGCRNIPQKGGEERMKGGSERMKGERMKNAIEINGYEKEKPQKVSSLNKLYYESQYGTTRTYGHAEHHQQMEENAEWVTNPSRVAEFLTGIKCRGRHVEFEVAAYIVHIILLLLLLVLSCIVCNCCWLAVCIVVVVLCVML